MTKVDTADNKAHCPSGLKSVESGEPVPVHRSNLPNAKVRPVLRPPARPRPAGIDRGMSIPSGFFEPLDDELLDAFEGDDEPA